MGFADSAIAIIKGNRHLQKQNQYLKRQILLRASDGIRGKRKVLSEAAVQRIQHTQRVKLLKQAGVLVLILTISFALIGKFLW